MTWAASLHTTDDGLAIRFNQPVQRVEMTRDKAREFAALLLVVAELDDENERQDAAG